MVFTLRRIGAETTRLETKAAKRDDVITAFGTGDSRVELAFVVQGQPLERLDDDAT